MAKKPAQLETYRKKRDFSRTAEPAGAASADTFGLLYVIQKHAAGRLHYDLRLEMDGVLKSWAVPKGPSLDPEQKRLAVLVEDHPLEYGTFEGIIPKGEYGGGTVLLWDRGEWEPRGDAVAGFRKGHLSFWLHGEKLRGLWALARMGGKGDAEEKNWLLIKKQDDQARPESEYAVTDKEASVLSGRSMEEIARAGDLVWQDGAAVAGSPAASPANTPVPDLDPAALSGARQAELPKTFRPQLAVAVDEPPSGKDWLHEIKYDGYRMLCFIDRGKVRFLTRRGQDWTAKFPTAAAFAAALPVEQAILDGEMVVLEAGGTTDFQTLQNLLRRREEKGLVYFVFDLPYLNGYDLTDVYLSERKKLLRQFVPEAARDVPLRFSDHLAGRGRQVFQHACRFALEGIVSKQARSRYLQKRSSQWRKVKCLNREEFVVGGFTEPGGERKGFGALLLGYYGDGRKLTYSGRVGTGFSEEMLRELRRSLDPLKTADSPFATRLPASESRGVSWVRPELVVEVEFGSRTRDGRLRHSSFKGVREDKEPTDVRRQGEIEESPEKPARQEDQEPRPGLVRSGSVARVAGVRLSHPERILYPGQGVTKRALAEFYQQAAELMLPHLAGRPLTLFRCPRGREEDCFFQKHFAETLPESGRTVPIQEKDEVRDYLVVDDLPGVIGLVQLGVLEFHPWLCRADRLERPDRMVFDLDPDTRVGWQQVIEAALALRELLGELGLESFVKTSGGKGLHVTVPLARRSSWDELKVFSRGVAERITGQWPRKYLATMSKDKRRGKIFIDHFRNSRGATSIAPYSTRARAGAPVSTPLGWEELPAVPAPNHYTVENLPRRLARLDGDPWEGFFDHRQSLTRGMKDRLDLE
jgi:bifunctional non-homologous end joining protein LigD